MQSLSAKQINNKESSLCNCAKNMNNLLKPE